MSRTPHTVGVFVANPADRRLLEEFLREAGHAVLTATAAAPRPAGWEQVSLLLVDEPAARQHGRRLVALKQRSGAVFLPLLILLPQRADGVAWLRAGFDDVLRLPLTRAELAARLSVFLRLREQAEEQYRAIFENVLVGIYRMTPEGRVLLANPAFARMLGYESPDELTALGHLPSALRVAPSQPEFAERVGCAGHVVRVETVWQPRTGPPLQASESARCVRDEAGHLLYFEGTIEDITERKQAEEELRQTLAREREMKEELATANRTKDEFLAMVSHELRTPLNAMLGWARLLRGGTLDAGTAAHAMEAIEASAKAQARLIEDLLDISRITTGKLRLNLAPTQPAAVIQAALDAVRPAAEAKGVHLVTRISPNAATVTADPDRLQQVVWNLLANAVKFTPGGGRVEIELSRADSQVEITVSDTGQGISPEFLPYVFERFRQADSAITRAHGGLGLGLSIARHLVEMHGGTIAAESEGVGRGTRFTIRLPALAVRPGQLPQFEHKGSAQAQAAASGLPRLDGVRVLVVDDEPSTCEIITTVLAQYGAETRGSSSAAEARRVLAAWRPDVLISDIGMPGEDGYEFLRQIRASGPDGRHIPAIALTAYTRLEDRMKALRAGFQMHVAKPAEPSELVAVIASLVQSAGNDSPSPGAEQV